MKFFILPVSAFAISVVIFFVWSWFVPIDIGYKGESPAGFYRFKIVLWELSNGTTLYVKEELGSTYDYVRYLVGQYDPLQ